MSRALVLGSAECLFRDLEQVPEYDVIAVNDAGWKYDGPIRFWVTLHPDNFTEINKQSGCGQWLKKRPRDGYITVAHKEGPNVDWAYTGYPDDWCKGGSSGLLAVAIGLHYYDELILCGIPMTPTPHFWGGEEWREYKSYWKAWEKALPELQGRVKSMSGQTRNLLGAPPDEWLTTRHK